MIQARSASAVLWYPCTLVDYTRLALLAGALAAHLAGSDEQDGVWWRVGFGLLVGASGLLDLLDGFLARRFNHTSRFGTLLDLGIDLLTTLLVWSVLGWRFAPVIIVFEWIVGILAAFTALRPHIHWKEPLLMGGPRLLARYFRNNQRNLLSTYGNIGHTVFPLAAYIGGWAIWFAYFALPGLVLYELVTLFMLGVLARTVRR